MVAGDYRIEDGHGNNTGHNDQRHRARGNPKPALMPETLHRAASSSLGRNLRIKRRSTLQGGEHTE